MSLLIQISLLLEPQTVGMFICKILIRKLSKKMLDSEEKRVIITELLNQQAKRGYGFYPVIKIQRVNLFILLMQKHKKLLTTKR